MTGNEFNAIVQLNAYGASDREIAEETGIPVNTVRWVRRYYGLCYNKGHKPPSRYYTVWNAKTDELIACGTAEECATVMGRSIADFHTMVSRVRSGKNKKFVVLVEDL